MKSSFSLILGGNKATFCREGHKYQRSVVCTFGVHLAHRPHRAIFGGHSPGNFLEISWRCGGLLASLQGVPYEYGMGPEPRGEASNDPT